MDRQFPPQRTKVQIVLGADREVELALERMQNQVHLIHDQTPITQQLQNTTQLLHIRTNCGRSLTTFVFQHVQCLQITQEDGFDGRRCGDDHSFGLDRILQLLVQTLVNNLGCTVKTQGKDTLVDNGRKRGSQNRARKLQPESPHTPTSVSEEDPPLSSFLVP